jgi:RNA polymerase sigma factor (sigma-70 family)
MLRRTPGPVLLHFCRALGGPDEAGDGELLEAFVQRRDDAAFAALVRRHGPMVLAVCRRLLRDDADVEDAFQATFLVLLRRARSVGRPERLAGFLYGVAYRTALKARGVAAHKAAHQRPLADLPVEDGVAVLVWRELRPLLDEELQRLPEKQRVAVVLCCLEGLSKREAARRLGWPEGTLSTRLHQARQALRRRLARRGLTLSAVAVAAALAAGAAPAALPAPLAAAARAGTLTAAAPRVAALAEGVIRAMWLSSVKGVVLALCAAGLVALGVGGLVRAPAAPGPEAPAGAEAEPARGAPPAQAPGEDGPEPKKFALGADVRQAVWSPDGRLLATRATRWVKRPGGTDDDLDSFSTVKIWDTITGREIVSLGELKNSGQVGMAFSPDGRVLALSQRRTIEQGDRVEMWEAQTGKILRTIDMDYGRSPPHLAFSPDGKTLAVLYAGEKGRDPNVEGLQGGARLWDVQTGKEVRSFRGHKSLAICLAFSPDGRALATGGDQHDASVRLWELRTGKLLWVTQAGGTVRGVAFSPDAKLVATGQGDGRVALLDAATGREVRALAAAATNERPAFSPDGRLLLCAGEDDKRKGETRLWEVATGKLLKVWTDTRTGPAFSPDGRMVAVLGQGGVLSLWDLKELAARPEAKPETKPEPALAAHARLIGDLLERKKTDEQVVEALFLAALGRFPTELEAKHVREHLEKKKGQRREAVEDALWALLNSKEYLLRLDALNAADPRKLK